MLRTLLRRAYRWLLRHHRCTYCNLARPAWMRGDHTACIVLALEHAIREHEDRTGGGPR